MAVRFVTSFGGVGLSTEIALLTSPKLVSITVFLVILYEIKFLASDKFSNLFRLSNDGLDMNILIYFTNKGCQKHHSFLLWKGYQNKANKIFVI